MIPAIGRTVHYEAAKSDPFQGCRPATIVRVWDEEPSEQSAVNMVVMVDGANDGFANPVQWKTSQLQGEGPGRWHAWEDCPVGKVSDEPAAE